MIYDYFLIKYWNNYSETPFEKFKSDCYQLFKDEYNSLPKKLQEIIFYLLKYHWFENYSTIEGVQKTLKGIGGRAKFENNLHQIIPEFEKNYSNLETDFCHFFLKSKRIARTLYSLILKSKFHFKNSIKFISLGL